MSLANDPDVVRARPPQDRGEVLRYRKYVGERDRRWPPRRAVLVLKSPVDAGEPHVILARPPNSGVTKPRFGRRATTFKPRERRAVICCLVPT